MDIKKKKKRNGQEVDLGIQISDYIHVKINDKIKITLKSKHG